MAITPRSQVLNPLGGFNLVPQDPAQVRTVAKSGAQFTSIQAAINDISDATAVKPYLVKVAAGLYTEDITLKDYVGIVGDLSSVTVLVGKITGTLAGSCGLTDFQIQFTPTADNQNAVDISGGSLLMRAVSGIVLGAGNFSCTGIKLAAGTGYTLADCTVTNRMTFAGITKDFAGWDFGGAGSYGILSCNVSDRVNAASGTRCLYKITGTGSLNKSNGSATFVNTNAAFAGQANGFCVSSAASAGNTRSTNGIQLRLTGAGAGTAIGFKLDSSGGLAEFQHIGSSVFISGFTPATEYLDSTATGDTQKLWIASTNKDLGTAPAGGLAITTPHDEVRTGFVAWSSLAGNIWSFTPATGTFSTLKRFTAVVKSSPVVAPTATLTGATAIPDLAVSYVYTDSTGALASTVTATEALYESNVPIFQVWRDGSNYLVARENHPLKFGPAVSLAWHSQFGPLLHSASSSLGVGLAGAKCAFTGVNTIGDHGITSTVAEAALGFTATFVYVNAAGKMKWYSTTDTFPAFWNNAGVPELATVGSNRWVIFRIGVVKDSGLTGSDTAQFVAVMDTVQNTSTGNATARITGGLVTPFPPELKALEVCQIGFVVVRKTNAGVVDTTNVPPTTALQVFGAQYVSGGTSTSAALITTNTTNFTGELSGAETSAQLCFDRIDAFDSLLDWGTGKSYRVGNIVRVTTEGFIGTWRCVALHTANADLLVDINAGRWEVVSNSEGPRELINQVAHGFAFGDVVYSNGVGTYAKATAVVATAGRNTLGIVAGVTANYFVLAKPGSRMTKAAWGLTANTNYFLSTTVAGLLTSTEPTITGSISLLMFRTTSTTSGIVQGERGIGVGTNTVPLWATGSTYAVGQVVGVNGGLYRCITANTSTTWSADKAKWAQVSMGVTASVANAGTLTANQNDLLYVSVNMTVYEYLASYIIGIDGATYLSTADGGNSRWRAVAGQYAVKDEQYIRTFAQGPYTITAGSSIVDTTATRGSRFVYLIDGNAAGRNIVSTTPFVGAPTDAITVVLVGQSDTNKVVIQTNDIAQGALVAGGEVELGRGDSVAFMYDIAQLRWVELFRTGGVSEGNRTFVTQANTFSVGQAIYRNGGTYSLAKADASETAEVIGIVELANSTTFTMVTGGYTAALSGLVAGTVYFLSDVTAGLITATEPTTIGNISKPLLTATTTTAGYVNIMRGVVVGGANARSTVNIASGTGPFTVQDVSAYTGGTIEGTVVLAATTPLKGNYVLRFIKNGAGTDYNMSVSVTGDVPATFTITAAGLIQATVGSPAGYLSAVFNYALNAPAVGATFPLSISAANVLGATDGAAVGSGKIGERIAANTIGAVTLSVSGTVYNAATITLPAGIWEVYGKVSFGLAGTSTTYLVASISATSATEDPATYVNFVTSDNGSNKVVQAMPLYITTAGATVYLTARMGFTGTAPATTATNTNMYAVRVG